MRISIKALLNILRFIFPVDTLAIVNTGNKNQIWIMIESGKNQGTLVFDLKRDVAFNIENRWFNAIQLFLETITKNKGNGKDTIKLDGGIPLEDDWAELDHIDELCLSI